MRDLIAVGGTTAAKEVEATHPSLVVSLDEIPLPTPPPAPSGGNIPYVPTHLRHSPFVHPSTLQRSRILQGTHAIMSAQPESGMYNVSGRRRWPCL